MIMSLRGAAPGPTPKTSPKNVQFYENEVVVAPTVGAVVAEGLASHDEPNAAVRDERPREVASLEQRALALETEVAALQAANRMKDEFLAIVSHELRTPLNAIIGWASIAQSQWADRETVQRALTVIARNGEQQARLINELLDVSRIMTGKLQIAREPVDLVSVIAGAVENVRPAAAAKRIDLQMEIDAVNCVVTGDAGRLTQIIWNLLSNAVKFTPSQGQVTVALDRVDADARLVVADSGPGIAPDLLPHIFDRFRHGDSTRTRSHGGLGLGLAVVRDLVAAHRGTVHADRGGPHGGAAFTVRLPLHVNPPDTNPELAGSEHELPHLDARIVVVDDDQDARELLEYLLTASGATVEIASSADEALERIVGGCDLVIADIGMPVRDGYSLLADIRTHLDSNIRALPVIAATAYTADTERQKALSAGFDDFVTKPIDPDRLTSVVSHLLARKAGGV
jgi:signal transduction histidine kinase/ActR/RegA family two-component response regulator